MKLTLIAAISILSALASGLAPPDLIRRETIIHPEIGVVVRQDLGPPPPPNIAEVSITKGDQRVETMLGFVVPPCTGTCNISFSDALPIPTGSRGLQLFNTFGYPSAGNTWHSRPPRNILKGNFKVSATGAGPAVVVEDFGLAFPCRTTTTRLGYNVGPVGYNDYVIWDIAKGGFVITCG